MKWFLVLLLSAPSFAGDCIIFRKERLKICVGMKVQSVHTFGHNWVEVMGINQNNPNGKVLIIKTGRDFHRMNSDVGDDLCSGCEPAGLDDIRVGADARMDSGEVVTPPDYSY